MELGTIFTSNEYDEAFKFVRDNGYTIKEIESTEEEVVETETYYEDVEYEIVVQEKQDAVYDEEGNLVSEAVEEVKEKRTEPVEKVRDVTKVVTVRQFQIVEIPVVEVTNEDISKQREQAYVERTDPLTLRKMRKQVLGEWTDEDETQYVADMQAISKAIEEEYPYKE